MSSKDISMKAKKIKVVRKWSKPKLVQDIQVFLGFANLYWWFIQSFHRIAALFTSILKLAVLSERLTSNKLEISDGKGDDGNGDDNVEFAKKSEKSKGQKLTKSQKSKGEKLKKPSKSRNLPNFNTMETRPSFLTSDARIVFNCLRLVFTKTLIFWHFDLDCYILTETDALNYIINSMLSQLASRNSPDVVATMTDLGQ